MSSIYTVGQVNAYIKKMFVQDFMLNRIAVKGEVSNCKYHRSGHIYFSLKDETGTMACVMFAGARRGLAFQMKDGDKVVAEGSVDVYERDGRYQLYARRITLEGAGLLYERFLALKAELEEMGMFAPEYKQPIPRYVNTLGVVTAPEGAAVRDIINVAKRRHPGIRIILYPARVQGEGAAGSVARGIRVLDRLGPDVIIVGRGGGSIEDLWAFNEEEVARAIFECRTPVISAVGHETDTTIADFAADMRAPTPSAGAELAVPDMEQTVRMLAEYKRQIRRLAGQKTEQARERLKQYEARLKLGSPQSRLREMRLTLDKEEDALRRLIQARLQEEKNRLLFFIERFKGLSPLEKMSQGYAFVTDEKGGKISRVSQVRQGDGITLFMSDGQIKAQVREVLPGGSRMEKSGTQSDS